MRMFSLSFVAAAMVLAAPAVAQISLPSVPMPQTSLPVPVIGPVVGQALDGADRISQDIEREIEALARQRIRLIDRLLRDNRKLPTGLPRRECHAE